MRVIYQNPTNGHKEVGETTWTPLWVLLWGPLYFAVKGIWLHALIALICAIPTYALSNIVYALFAQTIVQNHFGRRGWKAKGKEPQGIQAAASIPTQAPPPLPEPSVTSGITLGRNPQKKPNFFAWGVFALLVVGLIALGEAKKGPTDSSSGSVRVVSQEITPGGTVVTTLGTKPIPDPPRAISVSAEKLDREYDENELAAQAKYAAFNEITISGRVHSVSVMFGSTNVHLDTGGFGGVLLGITKESLERAKDIRRGQKVSATCRRITKALAPSAHDCVLN